MNRSDPKQSVRELLEEAHPALVGLSHWIHANPEVGFEEHHASDWVNEWLQTAGFVVERGVADMPTALVGRFGSGPFHVAICVEYDALPEVGHACGHNIIAATAVGAGLALAPLVDELDLRVSIIGTPAEEGGGGKILMLERGVFDGVHAAMMVHPSPSEMQTDPAPAAQPPLGAATIHASWVWTSSNPNAPLSVARSASTSPVLSTAETCVRPIAALPARIGSAV